MRFDSTLYYHFGEEYEWETLIGEFREWVGMLDQGGFTTAWMAEHHFHWDGWTRAPTNPILLGSGLISDTKNIRIGQCGVILPDWHPIRVAEDIALLDHLTKGRIEFGIARGFDNRASKQFNVNADRQNPKLNFALFAESLDVVLKAWKEDVFTFDGEFYKFPVPGWKENNPVTYDPVYHNPDGQLKAFNVLPKPYQKPHPPIFQMADSEGSHKFAGSRGIGTICMWSTTSKMNQLRDIHRAAVEQAGAEQPHGEQLAVMRPTYVAETYEEAVNDTRWGMNLRQNFSGGNEWRRTMGAGELTNDDLNKDALDFYLENDLVFVGSPESVGDQIERLIAETDCRHLALFHNTPGLTFDKVKRSLSLFAEKVIPRFQDANGG
jgi:alkanesulfonate monooxygenase SsuD/methylene tetrahydromethanopterin reductase-like flavin-dependent oxidoreductase (luciferase family)